MSVWASAKTIEPCYRDEDGADLTPVRAEESLIDIAISFRNPNLIRIWVADGEGNEVSLILDSDQRAELRDWFEVGV